MNKIKNMWVKVLGILLLLSVFVPASAEMIRAQYGKGQVYTSKMNRKTGKWSPWVKSKTRSGIIYYDIEDKTYCNYEDSGLTVESVLLSDERTEIKDSGDDYVTHRHLARTTSGRGQFYLISVEIPDGIAFEMVMTDYRVRYVCPD